jgi:hypothetical protein
LAIFWRLRQRSGQSRIDRRGAQVTEQDPGIREALNGLDEKKRATLSKLVSGGAFVAPIVASFAMQGIAIRPADAQTPFSSASNSTTISDVRLKRDVVRVGEHPLGFGIYGFKYLWSDVEQVGVLAQEVAERMPAAVVEGPGSFLAVNYAAIGMEMTSQPSQA